MLAVSRGSVKVKMKMKTNKAEEEEEEDRAIIKILALETKQAGARKLAKVTSRKQTFLIASNRTPVAKSRVKRASGRASRVARLSLRARARHCHRHKSISSSCLFFLPTDTKCVEKEKTSEARAKTLLHKQAHGRQ